MTDSDSTPKPAVRTSDTVELTVPADSAYVSLLRTVTASLAARRDFTIEDIDDLRIAVDEASALLLPHAAPGSQLSASFSGTSTSLLVAVSVAAHSPTTVQAIDQTSFAWMVLAALADEVSTGLVDGRLKVTLSKSRDTRVL
ncbi:anti-sigma regulatory factor [soil metagenome]